MADLKPCPFCDHSAALESVGADHFVMCDGCCAETARFQSPAGDNQRAIEHAIDAWNRRAASPADRGWVPVRERSPKVGEAVLVAIEFDRPGDWRIKVGGLRNDRTWLVFGASYTPSHWMPLPAAPQPFQEPKTVATAAPGATTTAYIVGTHPAGEPFDPAKITPMRQKYQD